MKESWIMIRDNKPSLPWWEPTREYRRAVDETEYMTYLILKIDEELQEVIDADAAGNMQNVLEELADVYEVIVSLQADREKFCTTNPAIHKIILKNGFAQEDIQTAADGKRKTHWSFTKGILLDTHTVKN